MLTLQWLTSHPGEGSNTLSCFMLLRNQDKLHLGEPVTSQLADGPTRRRIKSSRDVGELVVNPIQLIRS